MCLGMAAAAAGRNGEQTFLSPFAVPALHRVQVSKSSTSSEYIPFSQGLQTFLKRFHAIAHDVA